MGKAQAQQILKRLDKIDSGRLTLVTPDGKTHIFEGKNPGETAKLELNDWRVLGNIVWKGDIGFADDYRAGHWQTDDLTALITLGLHNKRAMDRFVVGNSFFRLLSMLAYLPKINSLKGSKKNIHAHYDLGNVFYKLWLDPSMTYSAAIFKNDQESLEQAQYNKYDRMLDCLEHKTGKMLEIGCGWGGFAERAQKRGDFNIKGITLSEEQHQYASSRLGAKAKIALEDYRHQEGTYDKIVSIEMFEAVGERYWSTYFSKIGALLSKKGKAVIQTITINEEDFPRYRSGGDFIRSYIFPGGMLPCASRFHEEVKKAGLKSQNMYHFGRDYARTLERWLKLFDQNCDQVRALGYDESFIRLWRFYLAACIAGFKAERTDVMQVELSHA
ncbi:MAG: class I SAM-dependent methyltransferase [Alphaproteobacteria bacterium]